MSAYSTLLDPPAPIIQVVVQNPLSQRRKRLLPALLDTGADVSTVPTEVINELQVYPVNRVLISGVHGQPEWLLTYSVRLRFEPNIEMRIDVIPAPLEFAILGRDVLNQLKIQLDGPALTTEIIAFQPSSSQA